jgi:large subunit ribosomal protein L9
MEIILKQDVEHLGYKNDVVKVKDGYAVNFLIPTGKAIVASSSNLKVHQENMRQQSHKAEKVLSDAKTAAEKISAMTIRIPAKAGESGKIFGSINTVMLAEALRAQGVEVERKNIKVDEENIRTLGNYTAEVLLHKEVRASFSFEVVVE